MRSGTDARGKVYAAPIAVGALVTFLLIDAMGSFTPPIDSGWPRELINQEPCWTPERPDDISRCELDD
jgi:hypothetical protein